jgi:hypothetical protein
MRSRACEFSLTSAHVILGHHLQVLGMDDVATTAAAPTPERIGSTSALDGLQLPLPPLLQAHQFSSANPLMMMGHGNSLLSSRTVSMPAAGVHV